MMENSQMDYCYQLPTKEDLYFSDVVWPQIASWHFDDDVNFIITKWKDGTPDEVKDRATAYSKSIIDKTR